MAINTQATKIHFRAFLPSRLDPSDTSSLEPDKDKVSIVVIPSRTIAKDKSINTLLQVIEITVARLLRCASHGGMRHINDLFRRRNILVFILLLDQRLE